MHSDYWYYLVVHWQMLRNNSYFLLTSSQQKEKKYILSNERNTPNRKLNHKFSSTMKVFMNIDVRYKYDKTFE